ncbi:MAG TPA: hypothetical protein VK622_12245 [Puia sp.]|nr:hypothetical protein [Puia sp.]
MSSEKYKLMFGGTPDNEVILGNLEKGSAVIKGKSHRTKFRKGNCVFPNRTEGYGRRLIQVKDAKGSTTTVAPEERIDASHKDYYGKVEWLPWNAPGGYPIEARLKTSCSSLDYQYQVNRLGLKRMEDDLDGNYLQYASGYQEFDVKTEGMVVEFLKIYFMNEDAVSKNPDSDSGFSMFKEVKEFNSKEYAAREVDATFDAVKIVKDASSFEKLKVLKTVLSRVTEITYNVAEENSLYDALILYASKQPKKLLEAVQEYKMEVSKLIEKGKAFNAFDLTVNGTIAVTQPKKEVLMTEAAGKDEEMLQWLFESCMEPEIFDAISKLNVYSQKFK